MCIRDSPHIGKEDGKLESEPKKMLGTYENGAITYADIKLSAQANRVPVIDGHLSSISVGLSQKPSAEDVIQTFKSWSIPDAVKALPSCPDELLIYRDEPDRPQPRLDKNNGAGLGWTVGKVRDCGVLDIKFMALTHNTLRGAASGSVLNAELLVTQGFIEK